MGYSKCERVRERRVEDMLDAYADARLDPAGPVLARIRGERHGPGRRRRGRDRRSRAAGSESPTATLGRAASAAPRCRAGRSPSAWPRASDPRHERGRARRPAGQPVLQRPPRHRDGAAAGQIDARLAAYEEQFEERLARGRGRGRERRRRRAGGRARRLPGRGGRRRRRLGDDADRLAHLEAVLAKHIAKLEALAARLPTEVPDNAVEHAIDDEPEGRRQDQGQGRPRRRQPADKPDKPDDPPPPADNPRTRPRTTARDRGAPANASGQPRFHGSRARRAAPGLAMAPPAGHASRIRKVEVIALVGDSAGPLPRLRLEQSARRGNNARCRGAVPRQTSRQPVVPCRGRSGTSDVDAAWQPARAKRTRARLPGPSSLGLVPVGTAP